MNKMKKILSLVLVVMLFASLVVSASAETITISNPIAGKTYNAYKVFDAEDDGAGNWKYTIKNTNPFFSVVCDGTQSLIEGLVITDPDGDGTYAVVRPEGSTFSAASFAETLMTALRADPDSFAVAGHDDSSITVADKGYYRVATSDGATPPTFEALAELTTAQDITIQDKNDNIFEKKADKVNVELGEVVNFTLTGKVPTNINAFNDPTYNPDKTFTYYVADKMTEGLTFNPASVVVTVDGTAVSLTTITDAARQMKDADLYRVGLNGYTFELCLDLLKDDGTPRFDPDKEIKITYSATVNEKAVTKLSNNKATLTYNDKPTDITSFGQQTPDVDLYSSRILIDKYETGQESHKLENAKFVLMNDAGAYYQINTAGTDVEWVTDIADATVFTTDANGAAEIKGLKDGTYKLIETEAPSGYTKIADPVDVIIDGSSATTVGYNDAQIVTALTNTASIANTPGSLLPSTGGIGTTIFYVLGGLLAAGAVIFLVSKKKAGEEA